MVGRNDTVGDIYRDATSAGRDPWSCPYCTTRWDSMRSGRPPRRGPSARNTTGGSACSTGSPLGPQRRPALQQGPRTLPAAPPSPWHGSQRAKQPASTRVADRRPDQPARSGATWQLAAVRCSGHAPEPSSTRIDTPEGRRWFHSGDMDVADLDVWVSAVLSGTRRAPRISSWSYAQER
jgi:hypothetical protein